MVTSAQRETASQKASRSKWLDCCNPVQSHVSKLGLCLVFRVIVLYKSFGDFHKLLEFYFHEVTETYVKVKKISIMW